MGFRSSLLDSCISDKINSAVSHATCQWNRQQLWFSCFTVYSQNTFKARRRNLRYCGENIWESHSETILITGQHLPKLCWKISSSSSWRISSAAADACSDDPRCPVRSSAALQDCLMPVSEALLIRCIQELRGRPGGLRHWASGRCPDLTSTACLSIWWTGVLASSLITWPNSASRLFAMISLTFGKLMVAAMSDFFTWSYHFTRRICRWQLTWKHCSEWESSTSNVRVSDQSTVLFFFPETQCTTHGYK